MGSTQTLVLEARRLLNLHQGTLGELLGVSRRTVQRWDSRRSSPAPFHLHKLAAAVYPKSRELAEQLALATGTTVEALGLVPQRPSSRLVPDRVVADALVCAAAEVLGAPPGAVRPALRAAFERAGELGLSVDDVVGMLAPADKGGKAKAKVEAPRPARQA